MKQYIFKNALIAEIDRLIEINKAFKKTWKWKFKWFYKTIIGRIEVLEGLKAFINTLEVKEVDLEKHLKEDIEDVFFDLNGVAVKGATHYLTVEDVKDIAKHFFELGLCATLTEEDVKRYKVQKGE